MEIGPEALSALLAGGSDKGVMKSPQEIGAYRVLRKKNHVYEKTGFPDKAENKIAKCRTVSVLSHEYKNY